MEEDKEWVRQVLSGEKQAYAHLINKYRNKVFSLLYRMTGNPHDAQDLAQECFIRAYRYLHSYDENRKFSSWLYRIAVNVYVDTQRSLQKKQVSLVEIEENTLSDGNSPETMYLQEEHASELHELIGQLPEKYRVVLLLRYVDELSYQEISDILEIPLHQVQIRLHRAKQRLRNYFQSAEKGGGLHEVL
ncbi:sigma-70 family RNA polymerase sigma factor [Brevibacillus ruminantium]|uniref:Sigma-70 family RNA polymerase sigma factor n=1 Tax=Brevibacillus ruminantium TaxID=2950604 RepID=A0ABY4WMA5_9BACL|nr:sigma-70 family RNA polymerase sigma factor [Brevibacillus ruminantium]USG67172.1 sigma-70 family RNA polymerase sigma factor [Brevibacillus ruminantium]